MLLERFRGLIGNLNRISFWGLENFDIGTALTVPVSDVLSDYSVSLKLALKMLVKSLFIKRYLYDIDIHPESKILFLYSQSYAGGGPHHKILFNKVAGLLVGQDKIVAGNKKKLLDIKGILLLIYFPIWLVQMRKLEIDFKYKLFLTAFIVEAKKWTLSREFKIFLRKYNLVVTFCDAHLIDNLTTQYCKKTGIATATMQHGWYRKTLQNADTFSDIELGFEGFVSDKFLAWGEYIKTIATQNGIDANKVECLGCPKFIYNNYKKATKDHTTNIFGIILGRSETHCIQENIDLIEISNQISQKSGMKYIVKCHPSDSTFEIDGYSKIFNYNFLHKKCDKDSSVENFIEDIEFSIVGSSSVYAELLYMGKIAFRYTRVNDDYDEVEWGTFINVEDLFSLIVEYQQDKDDYRKTAQEVGQRLCGKGDTANNYINFFNMYN